MAKNLQRKKPGYTKSGVAKIVSMNTKELVSALDKASKKKEKAKIARRLQRLGYVVPVVAEATTEIAS
jgi:SOS response regulatory protein OraA/RecX